MKTLGNTGREERRGKRHARGGDRLAELQRGLGGTVYREGERLAPPREEGKGWTDETRAASGVFIY